MTNSADPDQLASSEANWSGSTLFAKIGHVVLSKRRVKMPLPLLIVSQWDYLLSFYCFKFVSVASCLHSVSLMNGWILAKLTQIYHWVGEKYWLDFDDLDPIFKVTQGQIVGKGWKIACTHPISWRNKMDFDHTCTSRLLENVKELIRFWWPRPHFQGHMMALMVGKWLVCTLAPEWVDGFLPNLYIYIV